MKVSMKWEPRDLWVGAYWTKTLITPLKVYVCLLPCAPIIFTFGREWRGGPDAS